MDKYRYPRHKKKTHRMRKLFNDKKLQLNPFHGIFEETMAKAKAIDSSCLEFVYEGGIVHLKIKDNIKIL